jgi:hypothetical protein
MTEYEVRTAAGKTLVVSAADPAQAMEQVKAFLDAHDQVVSAAPRGQDKPQASCGQAEILRRKDGGLSPI